MCLRCAVSIQVVVVIEVVCVQSIWNANWQIFHVRELRRLQTRDFLNPIRFLSLQFGLDLVSVACKFYMTDLLPKSTENRMDE